MNKETLNFLININKQDIFYDNNNNLFSLLNLNKYINYNTYYNYYINNIEVKSCDLTTNFSYSLIYNDFYEIKNIENTENTENIQYFIDTKLKIYIPILKNHTNISISFTYSLEIKLNNKLQSKLENYNNSTKHFPILNIDLELEKLNIYYSNLVNPDTNQIYNYTSKFSKCGYNAVCYTFETVFKKQYILSHFYHNFIKNIEIINNNTGVYLNKNLYSNHDLQFNLNNITICTDISLSTDDCILFSESEEEIKIRYKVITLNDDSYVDFKKNIFLKYFKYITNNNGIKFN